MNLKNLLRCAATLALPIVLVSCGEENVEEPSRPEKGVQGSPASSRKDHIQIAEEYSAIRESGRQGMSLIYDQKSGEEFLVEFEKQKASLAALLEEAKELDPPTRAERTAVQDLLKAADKRGEVIMGEVMKTMVDNAEVRGVIGSMISDQQMENVADGIETLYGLRNNVGEPPAPE